MVAVVKWLRHRIVAPALVGSNPISHPIKIKLKFYFELNVGA